MHVNNLGLTLTANGANFKALMDAGVWGDPTTVSEDGLLDRAFDEFKMWRRANKVPCSQKRFRPAQLKKREHGYYFAAKAYNSRILLQWLSEKCNEAARAHPQSDLGIHAVALQPSKAVLRAGSERSLLAAEEKDVIINHKGELSRQLQDLLEVCLFAMQHLKVCRIQPKLLFVLRDQHDRSHGVHGDALRLMRKHLSEASSHLQLRLDELISLDPGSVFLLPSAFASDLEQHTGREVRWSTGLFAEEAFRLRRKIFREADSLLSTTARTASSEQAAPEFSTLPDWCLHAMSVWRVLDRYGPNLLHYKTIQEIELQREIEETAKQISSQLVRSKGGLSEQCQALLASSTKRLSDGESGNLVDGEFRSSLQAILESFDKRAKAELEKHLQSRRSKLPEAQKEEAKRKLTTPIEYQGELTRYTWSLCLADATDRDQLRALKVHFKTTIEHLWEAEASQSIAEEQARQMFEREWKAFEEDCRGRFERTARSRKQLSEEVCMVFNHVLRQHRHADQSLHILELVPATFLLNSEPFDWTPEHMAKEFLEVRHPSKLREFAATCRPHKGPGAIGRNATDFDILCRCVVPELKKRLSPALSMELPESSTTVPTEEAILEAIQKLNEGLEAEESRYLSRLGVRLQGGQVSLANALQLSLRQSVLESLQAAE
ncbi:unnamed protein product, partial [Symbiodinium sp. KB8]